MENNKATISGFMRREFTLDHETKYDKFYTTELGIVRTSGTLDYIPAIVPERLVKQWGRMPATDIRVKGYYQSYNQHTGEKTKLILRVFATNLEPVAEMQGSNEDTVWLSGYICMPPVLRVTPRGKDICDIMLAVPRNNGQNDYIPLILWREEAKMAATLSVADRLEVTGRIQSRDYVKKFEDGTFETRVAYEVSVSRVESVAPAEEK